MNQRSKNFVPTLVSTLLTLAACQPRLDGGQSDAIDLEPANDSQIIGGAPATDSDEITMNIAGVLFISRNSNNPNNIDVPSYGTAIIVSNLFVVTTAHTFRGQKFGAKRMPDGSITETKISLRFGANLNRPIYEVDVTPEDFSNPNVFTQPDLEEDLVFIRIPGGAPPGTSNMVLPKSRDHFRPGSFVKIAGYGRMSAQQSPLILHTGEIRITADDPQHAKFVMPNRVRLLGPWFQNFFLETDEMGPTSFCAGDSGAPLYFEQPVKGVNRLHLAGMHLSQGPSNTGLCKAQGYALRVDGLIDQAIQFNNKLRGN